MKPVSTIWNKLPQHLRSTDTHGRIIHCAGCTTGGAPPPGGLPINCQIFTTLCRLKSNDDDDDDDGKRSSTFWKKKSAPERENPGYVY